MPRRGRSRTRPQSEVCGGRGLQCGGVLRGQRARVTWFLMDSARMGSSAASAALLSMMNSRMKLVNQVAFTIR